MICLQDEFKKHGYMNLLEERVDFDNGFNLEDFFDSDQKPDELLSVFLSAQCDDLFLLLDGNTMEINDLCDEWDKRIRVFTVMNGKKEIIRKLKYNIVQLIVYSGNTPDKSREGNLLMSRKIIINGDLTNKKSIEIGDDEVIELPFYMVPENAFTPDENQMKQLSHLLPKDDDILSIMKKPHKRVNRRSGADTQPKYYSDQEFSKIRGWLER